MNKLIISLVLLSGCTGTTLVGVPKDASLYRCTDYNASISGTLTSTNVMAKGCQCVHKGELPRGTVTIVGGQDCSVTFNTNE